MCQHFPKLEEGELARRNKQESKIASKRRQAKQVEHSLQSVPRLQNAPSNSSNPVSLTPPSPPSSPCTLGLLQTPSTTPSMALIEDPLAAPKLPPPTRSVWTPFSHASVDLNLFARPDFENVSQAVYQSYYLGSLNPYENPYPVSLQNLGKVSSLEIADGFLPEDIVRERVSNLIQSMKTRKTEDHETGLGKDCAEAESVEPDRIDVLKVPTPVGTPWSNFVFDPKPSKSKSVSPATSNKNGKGSFGSPGNFSAPLQEMFSAKVPMTPVRARKGSKFVSTNDSSVQIHDLAYAQDNGKGAQILCKAVINPSYTPDVGPYNPGRPVPTLTYVGFEYDDQTCLTYIPIKDTRLRYKGVKKERLFGEEVPMTMKRSVFEKIKEMSIRAYSEAHPGMRIDCGVVEMQGKYITTGVMIKANRTVKIELEHRCVYRPALETLNLCKHDISGEALLHVRFSKTPDKDLAQLRFILFGIQINRTSANRGLKIFELVESERHDGNGGTGW